MNGMKRKMLVGAGLLGLGLLGAVLAQGMIGQQGNGAYGSMGGGTMGGMMGNGMMGGGMGMMSTYAASSRPISQDEARRRAEGFAARYGQGTKIRDFMVFSENFYVQVVDAKTGAGLGELLVDRYTGVVHPEYGPNMMWNTRYGMRGGAGMMGTNTTGMMGANMMGSPQNQGTTGDQNQTGMMGDQNQGTTGAAQTQPGQGMMGTTPNQGNQVAPVTVRYNLASAQKLAETFVAGYLPGAKVLEGLAFPGYYTFDYGRKEIEGMLSVNAYTGEVWVHGWHGLFLGEVK